MHSIDWFIEHLGRIISFLTLLLIATMSYEVVARYVFNSPTAWSYDSSYMIGGSMMILGASYTLLHKGHVRVDLLYDRFSFRVRQTIDLVFTVVIFFPLVYLLTHRFFQSAFTALERGTRSDFGIWMPLVWPFRLVISIAFALLLLSGISWFIRIVLSLKEGREL
jgi:TRAP-type mannitol/chloroaromatic compound transport system permease small subunit